MKCQEIKELAWVLWSYRREGRFLLSYSLLLLFYLFSSPYSVSRRYLKWINADDIYSYGATPLSSLSAIMEQVKLASDDHVFELGAGSGLTSLWLRLIRGCQVTAIEQVPGFVRRLNAVIRLLKLEGICIRQDDFLTTSFEGATVIYLFASNLDNPDIAQLAERLAELPAGTRLISISYPLQPYLEQPAFEVVEQFSVGFPWGEADVYVQRVNISTEP